MTVTVYSFVTANLWFSAFILLSTILRHMGLVFGYRLLPLLTSFALAVFRLVVPIETPFTQEICSTVLFPAVQTFLKTPLSNTSIMTIQGLCVLWAVVSVVLLVGFYRTITREYNEVCAAVTIPCPRVEACLLEILEKKRGRTEIRLMISEEFPTPMVVGLVRPIIMVPLACTELPDEELNCILVHEMNHIYGKDQWVKMFIRVLCCIMWWNPCVYLLRINLDKSLEYKCDLNVTKDMEEKDQFWYLQTLVDSVENMEKKPVRPGTMQTCFCGIMERSETRRRFDMLMNRPKKPKRAAQAIAIAVLVLFFIGSYGVVLQPANEPPAEEIAEKLSFTSENTFILKMPDGTYYLIHEDMNLGEVSIASLKYDPLCSIPIRYYSEEN